MSSIRLNQEIRSKIASAAVAEAWAEEEADLKLRRLELSMLVYRSQYPDDGDTKRLSDGYVRVTNATAYINFTREDGGRQRQYLNMIFEGSGVPMPNGHIYADNDEWGKEAWDIAAKGNQIDRDRGMLRNKIYNMTLKFTTVKALTEAWPAGKKYIPVLTPADNGAERKSAVKDVNDILMLAGIEIEE